MTTQPATPDWDTLSGYGATIEATKKGIPAGLLHHSDILTTEFRRMIEKASVDLTNEAVVHALLYGIALSYTSVYHQAQTQCDEEACFMAFHGHHIYGHARLALVADSLLANLGVRIPAPTE